ncbi:UDP-2,3-diacylglucosamine diphosphatase LpxI [Alphaproteobacteria bacterium]|nr:UDP-2,3-diacylglucosamine diphosphatase LpxI [Alphaproteobacteria bacterium]
MDIQAARFANRERSMEALKLGIIAGGGTLPALLASACLESGRDYLLLAIEGFADPASLKDHPHVWFRLGEGGKGIKLLRENGVEDVVLAGAVRRPSLKELRPDSWAIRFFAKLGKAWIGDNSLLSALVGALEAEGFRVVGSDSILAECLAIAGPYGKILPDDVAQTDIDRGFAVVRQLGTLDIGQATIVQQGIVLAVEGAEGTDQLIRRCADLHREGPGGVLVKARKPGQDQRVDLPTIGIGTIRAAVDSGLRGIAIEAGGVMVFDREVAIGLANQAGLFVIGV